MGIFSKLFQGLKKTKDNIASKLNSIFVGELNDEFYEDLEYVLISSDIGAEASSEIIEEVTALAKKEKIKALNDQIDNGTAIMKQSASDSTDGLEVKEIKIE